MTSKERAKLRAEANGLDPIFQIGKEGVTDAVIAQIEDTFNTRELFKIKVHLESAPESPKEIAQKLSEATGCDVIQVIGGTIVVFRINLILRQKEAEKKKRLKEKARKEALERRTERTKNKYSR
ncbi:MAG: YhbY family RNA-binding protein [Clostridia bacterium]|mgnify:FL=1|nr:YhbY family RNA-binding protein [Clostridia bacterium]MBQ6838580.1 YhbY family RNA-binding protein [Clostridia bacterium]